jgi:hypothetical protein
MVSSLHTDNYRKQVACAFGSARIRFSFLPGETIERLSAAVVAEMVNRGQGNQWLIEGNPREEIDFDFEYLILPIPQVEEVNIFLKQAKRKVRITDSWISVSDKIVRELNLPRGTLFRIYPVDVDIQRMGDDDHSYSFDWEEGHQYWFDIVHDHSKDPHDLCRQVRMVGSMGLTDSFVVPGAAQPADIAALWSKVIGYPPNARIGCYTRDSENYHWGYPDGTPAPTFVFTLCTPSQRFSFKAYTGSDMFRADQLSRILGVKIPPLEKARISRHPDGGTLIELDEEWVPLNSKIIRELELSWNVDGQLIHAPDVTDWWVPIDREATMRYGHSVDSSTPDNLDQAVFPPEPWSDNHLMIQVVRRPHQFRCQPHCRPGMLPWRQACWDSRHLERALLRQYLCPLEMFHLQADSAHLGPDRLLERPVQLALERQRWKITLLRTSLELPSTPSKKIPIFPRLVEHLIPTNKSTN